MSTIKFELQDELDELIARIYLDTKKKLSKKELLELIFNIGKQDYQEILDLVKNPDNTIAVSHREEFIDTFSGSIVADDPDNINPKDIWITKELD